MSFLPRKTILAPFDFSDSSLTALDTALEIAEPETKVHLIHVLPELHVADPGVVWQTIDNENRAQHATEALRSRLTDPKYDRVKLTMEFGNAGYRIAEFAKENDVDLIVMPSHGRTGISRLLIGSVAERVMRLAPCPVLILRS